MNDNEIFDAVIANFQQKYPNRHIEKKWDIDRYIVYIDGKVAFCPDGYVLLYNLKRLCKALDAELL